MVFVFMGAVFVLTGAGFGAGGGGGGVSLPQAEKPAIAEHRIPTARLPRNNRKLISNVPPLSH